MERTPGQQEITAEMPAPRPGLSTLHAARGRWLTGLGLIGISLLALVFRLDDFTAPWGQRGWRDLSALYAGMARNYVEQGYLAHGLAPAANNYTPADGQWALALHHPILQPILISFSYQLFGVYEWSARLLPVACSIVELLAIFSIAAHFFGRPAAWIAALWCAVLPATAYYGASTYDIGPMLLGLSAASFAFYLRYADRPSRLGFLWMYGALFVALGCDWPAYYTGACIAFLLFIDKRWRAALLVCALMGASLAAHVLVIKLSSDTLSATGVGVERGGNLTDAFFGRSTFGIWTRPDAVQQVSNLIARHLLALYTWPVLLLTLIGTATILGHRRRLAIAAFMVAGCAHTPIFLEGAARHEFWVTTAAPAMIPLAAWGLVLLSRWGPARVWGWDRNRRGRWIAVILALAVSVHASMVTCRFLAFVDNDRYYSALGLAIQANTRASDRVATSELPAEALGFYSRRHVFGNLDDHLLPATGLPPMLGQFLDVFVIPVRSHAPSKKLLAALEAAGYPHRTVDVDGCGPVSFFDLSGR